MANNFSKKRFLAMVCTICLIATSCFTGIATGVTAFADESVVPTPSNPVHLTLSDVGMSNTGTISATDKTYAPGFDNTLFSFYMKCSSSAGRIYFAGNGNYSGFCIVYNSNGTVSLQDANTTANLLGYSTVNIAPETVGIDSFLTDEVLYQFETHYLDLDNGGEKNDARLTLYINGINVGTAETFNRVDRLGNHFYTSGGTRYFRSHSATEHERRDAYEAWTFRDVGISDGEKISMTGSMPGPLDGSMFVGKMYFPTSSFGNFYIGTGDWYGIELEASGSDSLKLQVINGASNLATLNPTDAGVTLRGNNDLTVGISVDYFDLNTSAGTAKLKIGVWFNGELYKGNYFTTGDINTSYLARRIHTYSMNGVYVYSVSTTTSHTVPADFTKLTLNDLGINKDIFNDINNKYTNGYYPGSWDETVLSFNVNFGTWKSRVRYAKGDGSYSGICLYRDGNNIKFGADYTPFSGILTNVTVTPASLGLESFDNERLAVNFVTDYIDLDVDGEEDDIKVGCFINGVLVGGHYLYGYNGVAAMGTKFAVNEGCVAELSEIAVLARTIYETDYDFYTLSNAGITDGVGVAYGIFTNNDGAEVEGTAYDNIMFGAKVKFATVGARMHYAASDASQFSGIQLRLLETGELTVEPYGGKLSYSTIIIDPAQFDLETFTNTEFTLKITTDIVDANGSGDTDDIKVGFWINGILANNRYLYIMDQANDLGKNINFNEGNDTVRRSLWDIEAPNDGTVLYYQIATGHPYLVTADYMVNTRGDRFENGEEVLTAGDYTAYYSENGSLFEAEHTVVLWRDWDICPDEGLNILDLIALKKANLAAGDENNIGYRPSTRAGQMAVVNRMGAENLVTLRNHLIGKALITDNYIFTYAKSDENGLVMPIGAWISPTNYPAKSNIGTDLAGYGIETNFIQDKYYDMIEDLGINQLTYTEKDFNSSASLSILKGLGMAEDHGLTVFVDDSGIADNETDETILAERLNAYSRYSSFGGIHIADEPHTSSYSSNATTKTVAEISNKSLLINAYTNLFGYVNLYGDYTVDNTQYKAYLAEVIAQINPKVLSFDHYNGTTSTSGAKSYFGSLEAIREAGLENDIPFIGFISTGDDYTQGPIYSDDLLPTPEQIKWNVNTMLAYGAKGYNWFTLIQPWYFALEGDGEIEGMDFDRCGLIGANGEPTRNYDVAQEINTFVAGIDHILMASTSLDVLAVGTNACSVTGINKATYGDMTLSGTNAIVGVFDYTGKKAYYVVNDDTNASQNITLSFGSTKNLTVYTESGNTNTSASSQVLALGAGEAALVVVD